MKILPLLVLAAVVPVAAQSVVSDPIGFNKVTCLSNSDTVVGVPFRLQGSLNAKLASAPVTNGDSATLTLTATTLTAGAFTRHYVKFTSGGKDGYWYDITGNTTNTLTVNLNGDNLAGTATGDAVLIAEFWTLDTLFPPANATESPTTTGHAIVSSPSTSPRFRKTQVLLPNVATPDGINQAPSKICYITGGQWVAADASANPGGTILWPDSYLIIRHPGSITTFTVFKSCGEVEMGNMVIPLATRTDGAQDCYIAVPRPLPLRLNQLNLVESGAFVTSPSTSPRFRKDQILVFDNAQQLINKAPSAIYYHNGVNWLNASNNNAISDTDVIPAGSGFLIHKALTTTGATAMWPNPPIYTP